MEQEATELGLHLNRKKTELVCDDVASCEVFLTSVPGLHVVNCSQATLLGSPIGSIDHVDGIIRHKVTQLRLMGQRLSLLQAHDALLLLHHSFSIPKLLYLLCTSPCFLAEHLEEFDDTLRHLLCKIINVNLDNDSAWLQASLPVRWGGIGIHRAVQLAPSTFLASAAGCSELINHLLPTSAAIKPDPHIQSALNFWSQGLSHTPLSAPESHYQMCWDAPRIEATYNGLLESSPNQQAKARLLCQPHECTLCGVAVDELGTHGLSCRFSKGRHARHSAVNDIIKRAMDSAKIPSHLEPVGLYRCDGKRPDGTTMVPWKEGRVLVWDATCPDTLAPSHITLAAREGGTVAADAEHRKRLKYTHLERSHYFAPVAMDQKCMDQKPNCFSGNWQGGLHQSTMNPSLISFWCRDWLLLSSVGMPLLFWVL